MEDYRREHRKVYRKYHKYATYHRSNKTIQKLFSDWQEESRVMVKRVKKGKILKEEFIEWLSMDVFFRKEA
jgi:hypothetical protein